MPTLLHLLDRHADFQTRYLAESVAGSDLNSVGRDILCTARQLRLDKNIGLIHAWGWRPLLAAALANMAPIVHTPACPFEMPRAKWLKWICRMRQVHVICETIQLRSDLCTLGLAPDRCPLIPPGVPTPKNPARSHPSAASPRHGFRSQLNLSDDDFVVLAPGPTTRQTNHRLALWAVAMAYETSPTWKFLAWGRGPGASDLHRTALRMGLAKMIRFAPDARFENLLAAADAATATAGPYAGTLPLALCMSAGLPIAGTPSDPPKKLSQELVRLRTNPDLRNRLSATAAADAQRLFNIDKFHHQHSDLYHHILTPATPQSASLSVLSPQSSSLPLTHPDS